MTVSEYKNEIKGKRVGVLGLGISNMPLVDFLVSAGAVVTARDKKERADALSKYGNHSEFYLQIKDGYLCLSSEVIKKIDTPVSTDENGFADGGCGIDHEHKFFTARICAPN